MDGLVKGLVWVGSRTEHYGQMVAILQGHPTVSGSSTKRESSHSSGFQTAARRRSSAPPTLSTLTSPQDRSPVSWWTTSRVPAGV